MARRPRTACGAFPSLRRTPQALLLLLVVVLVVVAHWCGYRPVEVVALLSATTALCWRKQPKLRTAT